MIRPLETIKTLLPGRGEKRPQTTGAPRPGKKRKWVKITAVAAALVLILGGGAWFALSRLLPADAEDGAAYTEVSVERRDITASITGSGTLEAANTYSVTSLVEGAILTAAFEEGDQVEKGTVLYTIDSSDAASSLEQAQISVDQAQRSYDSALADQEDLTVRSTLSGQVVSLEVEVGDEVSAGQTVATVRDADTMTLTVHFPADDAAGFSVGQSAAVTLDSTFETLSGTVSEISSVNTVLSGNRITWAVTIAVSNPGGITTTQTATAEIGGVGSSDSGTFSYSGEAAITAKLSGTVASISAGEGDRVSRNGVILTLTSDTLADQIQSAYENLENAQLSYENQSEQLDNYTITAPISGTVVDKYYAAGENAEANVTMCTIYDMSYLTMTLSVDELDISSLSAGQTVTITADAVEDAVYTGVVTKVSVAGTASGGVTTYPVTIRIDETEGLLPGMTVDAVITLDSAEDALAIPSAALQRGNTVLITADSPSAAGLQGENADGYVSVEVTTGTSDDSYTEILSGLQEGDVVAYIPTSTSDSGMSFGMGGGMPGGMGGGMPSGGIPGGGMQGGGF